MPTPFLSSEEYDERAHALYNEGQYDEALEVLREGLALYPQAVELHVGIGYARLAREEYVWARKSFEEALILDAEHEDALAGLGETLLKFGQLEMATKAFERTVTLGYDDDLDLMLQIGRAQFREGLVDGALSFFERAVAIAPDSAEAAACIGYAQHRLGHEVEAVTALRRALAIESDFGEARVYLANIMYDAGDMDAALAEFEKTTAEDHWDELGIWRLMELKKSAYQLDDNDGELKVWEERLVELAGDPDAVDELLAEVEQKVMEEEHASETHAEGELDALDSLLLSLTDQHTDRAESAEAEPGTAHSVLLKDGRTVDGTWEQIVELLRDERNAALPIQEFMVAESRRQYGATGADISTFNAEEFIRGSARAGLLRIVR
ncbi:MAG: tetratricopeptide repeat protein [Phycisphaerae bacterium]|nr:tetratricopeptide repeat protein [Gemmatimonadaceae bacterium]